MELLISVMAESLLYVTSVFEGEGEEDSELGAPIPVYTVFKALCLNSSSDCTSSDFMFLVVKGCISYASIETTPSLTDC